MSEFSRQHILSLAIGRHDQYCEGNGGASGYLTALVMGIGLFPKTFSHQGSELLDRVLAYDSAEVDDAYLGQINMTLVSSFCGPEGLIWGYDVARKESSLFPAVEGDASPELAKIRVKSGHRARAACVLMEDVGKLLVRDTQALEERKHEILVHMAQSVLEIGKNQGVEYSEIFVDCIVKNIPEGSVGCPMVAMPYFRLAKNAYDEYLHKQSLDDWAEKKSSLFLSRS